MKENLLVTLHSYELEEHQELAHLVDTLDCAFTYIPEDDLYYISFYNEDDFDLFNDKCAELIYGVM